MLASVPDAIIAVDSDGMIVYVNDQGESLFGWSRVDLLGRSVDVLVPDRFVAQHPAVRNGYFAQPTTRPMAAGLQLSARRRDGSEFPAEIRLSASDAGPERWVLAAVRDVTKSRQSERDLDAARLEAVQANAAKDEFLSRISHELRTPLNAILGFGQLLALDDLAAGQVECVSQILRAGSHLLGLVDEVLDISQVAQGALRLSLEPVSLRHVVDEVIGMIRPLADRREIRVNHPLTSDVILIADRQRIKQVLTNLVANAVKYNRHGGSVHIDSAILAQERCRLTVTDTGPGIADTDLEALFTPFQRLPSAPADVEGSGLGLALAKRLIEAMHGEIGVISHVGFGSSFWIELPGLAAPPTPAEDAPPSPTQQVVPPDQTYKTVLYIEDNPSNTHLLERAFTRRPDVRLIVAMEGRAGLELAFEHRPDLILLDLGLPDITGEEVLRRLRADPRTSATAIIVISADAMPHRPAELLVLGATGYITKPFDIDRLLSLVDNPTAKSSDHWHR
jgi:PAS domain S-box-containing protein